MNELRKKQFGIIRTEDHDIAIYDGNLFKATTRISDYYDKYLDRETSLEEKRRIFEKLKGLIDSESGDAQVAYTDDDIEKIVGLNNENIIHYELFIKAP